MIALALPLGVAMVLGAVFDRALLADPSRGAIERLGRALMLGLGLLGSLALGLDGIGLGVSAASVGGGSLVLLLLLAPLALRVAAVPELDATDATARVPLGLGGRVAWAGLLGGAAVSLALVVRSGWLRPTFQFDALTRWMLKAKVIALDGTLLGAISHDPGFGFTHQRYPPLVSYLAAMPNLISGVFDDRIASAMFPWFAVALAAVLYGAVSRRVGRVGGALAAFWFSTLPLVAYLPFPPPGSGAFSAMADLPLALFATGALLAAADAVEGRRARAHLEAGVLLGFATLTKNEGLPLLAGVGLAFLLFAPTTRWRRALGVTGLAACLQVLLWTRLALGMPTLDEHYPDRLTGSALVEGLERLPSILWRLAGELGDLNRWNVTWLAAAALMAVGLRRLRTRGAGLILVAVGVQIGAYVLAYVVTSWTSPAAQASPLGVVPYLMDVTLGRLLLHVAPAVLALAVLAAPPRADRAG